MRILTTKKEMQLLNILSLEEKYHYKINYFPQKTKNVKTFVPIRSSILHIFLSMRYARGIEKL